MTPRTLIRNALLFVALGVLLDQLGGLVLTRLMDNTRSGEGSGSIQHALDHAGSEVVFFGSSRVKQHLDPAVVAEHTGWSAYNAAANGQGLPYARGLQALLLERSAQRCHVLHLDVVDSTAPKLDRAVVLTPFYRQSDDLKALLWRADPWAPVKSLSSLWRFNSVALSILRNQGARPPADYRGFEPKKARRRGFADAREFVGADDADPPDHIDPVAEDLLEGFTSAARARGTAVVWVTSPMSPDTDATTAELDPVRAAARDLLAAKARALGVPYRSYDEVAHPQYRDPELFVDRAHLHAEGAALLSRQVAAELADLCAAPSPR